MTNHEAFKSLAAAVNAQLDKSVMIFTLVRGKYTFTAKFAQLKNGFNFVVHCPTAPLPALTMRVENATDRFGKRIGLNRELETGEEVFDTHVYTESHADDETVLKTLASAPLRQGTLFILQRSGYASVVLGQKGVTLSKVGSDRSVLDPQRFEETLGALTLILDGLPTFAEYETHVPKLTIGGVVVLLSIVALIFGIVFPIVASTNWRAMDWRPWYLGWLAGLVAWVVWVPVCGRLVRHRSDSMRNFLVSFFLMLPALPLIGGASVVFANGFFDTSAPVEHQTTVLRRWTTRSKNSTNYHTKVASWRPGEDGVTIGGSSFYNSKREGGPAVVVSAAGALGYEWIVSYR
jgi:hypothetical protein